jgi:hypothetical protein
VSELREQIDNLFHSYACGKLDAAIRERIVSLIRSETLEEAARVAEKYGEYPDVPIQIRALKGEKP